MTLTAATTAVNAEAAAATKDDKYKTQDADAEQEQQEEVEQTTAQLEKIVEAADDTPDTEVANPEKKQSFMEAAMSERLRPFVIISFSYLLFTITA
jgi:Flp pilus assembly protein TadB